MSRPHASEKHCVVCGDALGTTRKVQPHCLTDECNLGYAKILAANVVKEDDCEIWQGSLRKGGVAYLTVKTNRDGKAGGRRDFRVLDVRNEMAGVIHDPVNRNYVNLCGRAACVNIEHNRLQARTPTNYIGARLPAEPLIQAARGLVLPKKFQEVLRKARIRGTVTVTQADEFCIDALRMHPVEIYGEEFFTV